MRGSPGQERGARGLGGRPPSAGCLVTGGPLCCALPGAQLYIPGAHDGGWRAGCWVDGPLFSLEQGSGPGGRACSAGVLWSGGSRLVLPRRATTGRAYWALPVSSPGGLPVQATALAPLQPVPASRSCLVSALCPHALPRTVSWLPGFRPS